MRSCSVLLNLSSKAGWPDLYEFPGTSASPAVKLENSYCRGLLGCEMETLWAQQS